MDPLLDLIQGQAAPVQPGGSDPLLSLINPSGTDAATTSPASPGASGSWAPPATRMGKIGQGIVDPIDGGAQLLTHLLPDGVVNAGNSLNNWLADKTGLLAKLPPGGIDAQISSNEKSYQSSRRYRGT